MLATLLPEIRSDTDGNPIEYCFCTFEGNNFSKDLNPLMTFYEKEGTTLILEKQMAADFEYSGTYNCLTLTVHSSLEAVGLTAFVSKVLADNEIPANVVAAFYHDHIFVPSHLSSQALTLLQESAQNA